MIKKAIEQAMTSFKDNFGNKINWPKVESDNITVNMDGGVGGSWKVECAIDETPIDCEDLQENYTGIPAPAYLTDDPWFGPAPVRSEKQLDYMERETQMKQQEEAIRSEFTVESEDIHAKMYEIATASNGTAVQRDPIGGSESFHESGWMSGTGLGQFH